MRTTRPVRHGSLLRTWPTGGARALTFVGLAAALFALFPLPAEACTCLKDPETTRAAAFEARKAKWKFVYVARALPGRQLQVLEVFRGPLTPGERTNASVSSLCDFPFADGELYLVYDDNPLTPVALCSPTRRIDAERLDKDAELRFLRRGVLPAEPGGVRRALRTTCTPCTLEAVARSLTEVDALPSDAGWLEPPTRQRPWARALGFTRAGRPFELHEEPPRRLAQCEARIERQWCRALALPDPDEFGDASPALRCVGPMTAETVCDETRTRTVEWGPLENLNVAECRALVGDEATCSLTEERRPLLFPFFVGVALRCRPLLDGRHDCFIDDER